MKKNDILNEQQHSIANQPTSKKISFFSAMLIVMGSSIGAGIFFKAEGVLKDSQGSIIFAILAWIIAAFAVVSMALVLVEIASARNDNLSLIGWCKVFNSEIIYKASKNFMVYIYLPLTFFFMPYYVIMTFQDAFIAFGSENPSFMIGGDGRADWVVFMLIAFTITSSLIFISGVSARAGNLINKLIMCVKFFPLVIVILLGIIMYSMNPELVSINAIPQEKVDWTEFKMLSPGLGLFMAVGAIFFAYDGFYVTAGLQTEMKEQKKTPIAILFGLISVTIIYLMIAIVMSLGANGELSNIGKWLKDRNCSWVFGLLNLCIGIGILGIINGYAMWSPRLIEDLIREREIFYLNKYKDQLNYEKPIIGVRYTFIVFSIVFFIFSLLGAEAYINNYDADYGNNNVGSLYSFCDLMSTWTSVFVFMFIMLPIVGGIKNRKTKKVDVEQKKYFIPFAWISSIIISIVLIILFMNTFINVLILINYMNPNSGFVIEKENGVTGRVTELIVLFIFIGSMFLPTFIENKFISRKNIK